MKTQTIKNNLIKLTSCTICYGLNNQHNYNTHILFDFCIIHKSYKFTDYTMTQNIYR